MNIAGPQQGTRSRSAPVDLWCFGRARAKWWLRTDLERWNRALQIGQQIDARMHQENSRERHKLSAHGERSKVSLFHENPSSKFVFAFYWIFAFQISPIPKNSLLSESKSLHSTSILDSKPPLRNTECPRRRFSKLQIYLKEEISRRWHYACFP